MEQCTAHGLVIETVQGLRENQKDLINEHFFDQWNRN